MSFRQSIVSAVQRRRQRFQYEIRRPRMSVTEVYAALTPGVDVDLMAPDGFARLWAVHAETTPPAMWSVAPAATPSEIERAHRSQTRILARNFPVTPETDWHREPFHGVSWPRVHVESCPQVIPGADIVLLWRLNRMECLRELAAAYRTTSERIFADRIAALMDSWARANPFMVGANWIRPVEIGVRLYQWSVALAGIARARVPSDETCRRILCSVLRQADFLALHFSTGAIPDHHRTGEAATLAALSAYWPILNASRGWMEQADATMLEEARRQVLKDGFQFENSVNCHVVSLDFFLLYLHAKLLRGETPPALVLEKTRAMVETVLALVSPAGRMPGIGDDSTTRLMVIDGDAGSPGPLGESVVFEAFLRCEHARLFATTSWGRDLLALRRPLAYTRRFEEAGVDVFRARDSHVVFTHGPQHRRLFPNGHLHADAGSFELELDGSPVVVDSGTYLYGFDAALRNHMRSARAHNTMRVDGAETMQPTGTFEWGSVAPGEALGFGAVGDVMATGCRRFEPGLHGAGVDHVRVLVRVAATVLVIDRMVPRAGVTAGEHTAELYFHTPARPGVAVHEGSLVRLPDPRRFVRIFEVIGDPQAGIELIDPTDPAALYSTAYGECTTGTTIRVTRTVREAATLVCALRSPEVSVTHQDARGDLIACVIDELHVRRLVDVRLKPFGVFVGGRAIVGAGTTTPAREPVQTADSLAWLDEIDA